MRAVKTDIVGYIVVSEGTACSMSDYGDGYLVLTKGGDVHLFTTRKNAHQAVARTNRYASREGLGWPQDQTIHRVIR